MKAIAVAVLMFGAGLATQASAQVNAGEALMAEKWTFRFDAGGNIPDNPGLTLHDGFVTGGDSMELSAGFQMDLSIGYRMAPWLTLEGELGFAFNEVESIGNWSYPNSSLSQMSMMLNVVFEKPVGSFVPYVGIGAGGVFSSLTFGNYDYYYYYGSTDGYGTDFVAAAQLLGGIRYQMSHNSSLGVSYRYRVTDGQKWDVDWWVGPGFTVGVDSITAHSFCLVYSYDF